MEEDFSFLMENNPFGIPYVQIYGSTCDQCKKSHRKCDGKIPSCDQCIQRTLDCTHEITPKKRGPKKKSTGQLAIQNSTISKKQTKTSQISSKLLQTLEEEVMKLKEQSELWKTKCFELEVKQFFDVETNTIRDTRLQPFIPFDIECEKKTLPLCSSQAINSIVGFREFVNPLLPRFTFNACIPSDVWEILNVPLEKYSNYLREQNNETVFEQMKYSIILAHGTAVIDYFPEDSVWFDRAKICKDILFEERIVQEDTSNPEQLLLILMLFADFNFFQANIPNFQKIILEAYNIFLLYKEKVTSETHHFMYIAMTRRLLAGDKKQREKWLRKALNVESQDLSNIFHLYITVVEHLIMPPPGKTFFDPFEIDLEHYELFQNTYLINLLRALYPQVAKIEKAVTENFSFLFGIHTDMLYTLRIITLGCKASLSYRVGEREESVKHASEALHLAKNMNNIPHLLVVIFVAFCTQICQEANLTISKKGEDLLFKYPTIYPKCQQIVTQMQQYHHKHTEERESPFLPDFTSIPYEEVDSIFPEDTALL